MRSVEDLAREVEMLRDENYKINSKIVDLRQENKKLEDRCELYERIIRQLLIPK